VILPGPFFTIQLTILTERRRNEMPTEQIIDSFAGGGGASLGIAWALGRGPDIAINHDANAIAMHEANHPDTYHVLEEVWKTDLKKLVGRRKVGLLWLSPDCKHFSRAKGGKPVEKRIRSLAWIACKWAEQIKPRVIFLENVLEFEGWGPLVPRLQCSDCQWAGTEGQATLVRTRRKCPRCESRRIKVQLETMVPCPLRKGLTFKRFVMRLERLGYRVQWRSLNAADYGAPTHRRRLFLVARNDGKAIVWPDPTHSPPHKCNDMSLFGTVLQPHRTAAQCIDWSIPCPSIFDRKKPLAEKTLRRIAMGIKRFVIDADEPFIVNMSHGGKLESVSDPVSTIATEKGGCRALAVPVLSKYHGQKADESRCSELERSFATLDTQPRFALVSAFIAKHFGGQVGTEVDKPLPTTTMRGTQNQVVAANLIRFNFDDAGVSVNTPMMTATTNNHAYLVYRFLIKYFGTAIGANLFEPAPTATGKDRFGLVTVQIDGEAYIIVDIGMRMLTPRELARAQGFPDTYLLTGSKTSQVARIGNSVCPHVAAALVAANYERSGKVRAGRSLDGVTHNGFPNE